MTNTFAFETAAIPADTKSGRKAMPNPFTEHFPSDDAALSLNGVNEGTDANRLVRQAREAAKNVDRTARVEISDPVNGKVDMKFWTVERIVRSTSTDEATDSE